MIRYAILALALAAAPPVSAQLRLVPFDVRTPAAPVPVTADGKVHLVYELRITNLGSRDVGVSAVEVRDGGRGTMLLRLDGDALKAAMGRIAAGAQAGDARVIPGGRQAIAYLWVTAEPIAVPQVLEHRFLTGAPDSLDAVPRDTLVGPVVPVRVLRPPVIAAPLRGGPWVAANGPSNTSGHRRTAIPLGGVARVAQRFATDWVKLGPDGHLWQGDSTRNANWYGYGAELLAVAPGLVVAAKDSIPENVPLAPDRAVPITLETVGGNHVIIDIGGGFYAFYAHLQPGSLRVKRGDRVRPGQVIGLLGNSGNSDAPHLHFHMGDAPSPLATEGMPFVLDGYEWLDRVANAFDLSAPPWKAGGPAQPRRREIPLENDVVRFR